MEIEKIRRRSENLTNNPNINPLREIVMLAEEISIPKIIISGQGSDPDTIRVLSSVSLNLRIALLKIATDKKKMVGDETRSAINQILTKLGDEARYFKGLMDQSPHQENVKKPTKSFREKIRDIFRLLKPQIFNS